MACIPCKCQKDKNGNAILNSDCEEHGSAAFMLAVEIVRCHEAKRLPDGTWLFYDKNPADPGGATAWGISKTLRDRYNLTPADCGLPDFSDESLKKMEWLYASEVYRKHIWEPMKLWRVNDQIEVTKILDCAVNLSRGASIRFAQRACLPEYPTLNVDGLIGPKTVEAINGCCRFRWLRAYGELLARFYKGRVYGGDPEFGNEKPHPELAYYLSPPTGNWLARAAWGVPEGAHPV